MIFPFPYSNLYNLNLDWMIKTMKEMQAIVEPLSRVVNSVNGMTGDVQITKQFLLQILESMVSKFNGRAGDVTLTAADVNSTMIDITWTSDPGDVIEDIAQNVRDQLYAIGKRVLIFVNNQGVPDQIYFLTLVGDVVTPQIYSPTAALAGVASFNGQTGAVTATGSDLDTANDDDTPISESIGDLQTAVSNQSQQIGNLGPYNGLDSTSIIAALSAAQGKYLHDNTLLYKGQATGSFNSYTETGIYYGSGLADGPQGTNGYGGFAVFNAGPAGSASAPAQLYWGYDLTILYFRQYNHVTQAWTNWKDLNGTWKTLVYNESGVTAHSLPSSFTEVEILVCSNGRQLSKRITYDALANIFTQVAEVAELMITDFIVNANGLPEWGGIANIVVNKTTRTLHVDSFLVFQGSSTPIDSTNTALISIYYR